MEQTLNLQAGTEKVIMLEGVAESPRQFVKKVELSGNISAVNDFISKRVSEINKLKSHVIVNSEAGTIALVVNEDDTHCTTVSGAIARTDAINKWHINGDKVFSASELASHFRLNAMHFASEGNRDGQTISTELILKMQNLKVKIESTVEECKNDRGNAKKLFEKNVNDSTVPTKFLLSMPIIKGGAKLPFTVNICLETNESKVVFWLESAELRQLLFEEQERMLLHEIAKLPTELVVINK